MTKFTNKHSEYLKQFFNISNSKTNETQRYVCQHMVFFSSKFEPRLNYQPLTLAADPVHSTLLHIRENRIRIFEYLNRTGKSSYSSHNALNFRSSTHQRCVKNFYFLQALGTWYVLMHTHNAMQDRYGCSVINYGYPEGNMSLITKEMYDIRWVHNIHCLFTAILRR